MEVKDAVQQTEEDVLYPEYSEDGLGTDDSPLRNVISCPAIDADAGPETRGGEYRPREVATREVQLPMSFVPASDSSLSLRSAEQKMRKLPTSALTRNLPVDILLKADTSSIKVIVESPLRGTQNSLPQTRPKDWIIPALESATVPVTMKDILYGNLRSLLLASISDAYDIDLSL
eukprot:scaffold512296_cov16-Prasinocladus_malaysianus.AAC.1